jgi:hypothetical protein
VPEALIKFTAAGHIRFGIGGGSDGDLSADVYNEYLPVIVVPISTSLTYYRKFFVENIDIVPFYKWKIKVESNRPEISVSLAYDNNPDNFVRNSETAPEGISNWTNEVSGAGINKPLFEPNKPLTFWLKIAASPQAEKYSTYTVTITFEGYS